MARMVSSAGKVQHPSEVLIPVSVGRGNVLVRSADGRIAALDAETGAGALERVVHAAVPDTQRLQPTTAARLNGVLVGLDDGRVVALNLANGRVIWESVLSVPSGRTEVERLVDVDADIRVDDNAIYVVNYQGRLARLEPARGQVGWSQALSSTAGLALSGERVFSINEDDEVVAFDKESGQSLWTQKALRGRRLNTPVTTADGDVLVADFEGYVHLLSADDGHLLGRTRVGKASITGPIIAVGEQLFAQSADGVLASLRLRAQGDS